jgi:hypothetical protein
LRHDIENKQMQENILRKKLLNLKNKKAIKLKLPLHEHLWLEEDAEGSDSFNAPHYSKHTYCNRETYHPPIPTVMKQ